MVKEQLFEDRASLFSTLAAQCQEQLAHAITKQGQATLMVSGGSTPSPLFERLSQSDLAWDKIHLALVDERWVDRTESASNEALIAKTLLTNRATAAPFTGMKTTATSAAEGQAETEALYQTLPKPFTVTLLGMGSDGHTASLFPHAEGLSKALSEDNSALTAAITAQQSDVTGPNTERLTLTLTGLLQSERLIVLLTGDDKLAVFREAMSDLSDSAVNAMPIRALLRQKSVPVELYWAP